MNTWYPIPSLGIRTLPIFLKSYVCTIPNCTTFNFPCIETSTILNFVFTIILLFFIVLPHSYITLILYYLVWNISKLLINGAILYNCLQLVFFTVCKIHPCRYMNLYFHYYISLLSYNII